MRIRPMIVASAAVAAFGLAGCGSDNNSNNDNTGGGTPVRTSTPAHTPTAGAVTPTAGAVTPTAGAVTPTSSGGGTPGPTPTGGVSGACEGAALNVTVTTDAGSDLDTGWTGIAHKSVSIEQSTVTTALNCDLTTNTCTVDGSALVNTPFGSPLPLSSGGVPVCVLNTFREAVTGTYDCTTGCSESQVKITSKVILAADVDKPCPLCNGDPTPNDGKKEGTCSGATSTPGAACDVGGISAVFGPTSNDCVPSASSVAELPIDLVPLTTGTTSVSPSIACKSSGAQGQCYCPGQDRPNACTDGVCPASGICDDPVDLFCSNQKFFTCFTDGDCEAVHPGSGTCVAVPRPCFGQTISRTGTCGTQSGTLAALFCIAATRAPAVNTTAGLPGPGALLLPAHQVRTLR